MSEIQTTISNRFAFAVERSESGTRFLTELRLAPLSKKQMKKLKKVMGRVVQAGVCLSFLAVADPVDLLVQALS